MVERSRVLSALVRTGASSAQLDRFKNCGTDCVVEYSPSEQRFRLRASYCGHRLCQACGRARSIKVQQQIKALLGDKPARFVTLTFKGTDAPLWDALNRAGRDFAKLRKERFWREAVDGGAFVLEFTRGRHGTHWHVHIHALVVGRWFDVRELKAAWASITKDSFIVHVRKVDNNERASDYLGKYVAKGFDHSQLATPDLLDECVLALRGRRLLATFGSWHGERVERERHDPNDWRRVDRLDNIARAAERGERWALDVLRNLGGAGALMLEEVDRSKHSHSRSPPGGSG